MKTLNQTFYSKQVGTHSVVACIVSYNNSEELDRLIVSIVNQTVPVSRILIIENSDNLMAKTCNRSLVSTLTTEVMLIETERNLGSAGGFSLAMRLCLKDGVDAVWLLDQDGEAEMNCLEELLKYYDKQTILCPVVISQDGKELPYFRYITNSFGKNLGVEILETKDSYLPIEGFGTHGVLVPRSALNEIGVYDDEHFFVGFEDFDYSYRAQRHNIPILLIRQAIVYHPDLAEKHKNFGAKMPEFLRNVSHLFPVFLGAATRDSHERFTISVYSRAYLISKSSNSIVVFLTVLYSSLRLLIMKAKEKRVLFIKSFKLYVSGIKEGRKIRRTERLLRSNAK